MTQGKYVSESIQDLIRRAEQILGETSISDTTNWQSPIYTEGQSEPLSRIILKNNITVINANIVICTGSAITTCSPGTCSNGENVSPNKYINMVATVNLAGVAQTGVVIQFNYLINDVPITDISLTQVTVNLTPGNNSVYLFPTNHTYDPNTSITLHGATVVSS